LGYSAIPNSTGFDQTFSPPIEYRINSDGFRDTEFLKKTKTIKIMALGSSYPFGIGLHHHQIWPHLLEKELCDVSVFNISAPGYANDQNLILLDRWLNKNIQFDYVILQLPSFSSGMHLSQLSWSPTSRKPYLEFKGDHYKVYPAEKAAFGLINGEFKNSLLARLVAGYNRLIYHNLIMGWPYWNRSRQQAHSILKTMHSLVQKHGAKLIWLVNSKSLLEPIQGIDPDPLLVDVTDLRGEKYRVNEEIRHMNFTGTQTLTQRLLTVFDHSLRACHQ
jgi:hypothetical protein